MYLGNAIKNDQYDSYEVDKLEVFVSRKLDVKPSGLKIHTTGMLFFKTIDATGVRII